MYFHRTAGVLEHKWYKENVYDKYSDKIFVRNIVAKNSKRRLSCKTCVRYVQQSACFKSSCFWRDTSCVEVWNEVFVCDIVTCPIYNVIRFRRVVLLR